MERRDNQSPQAQAACILVEFLEAAITYIVFLKGVYPSAAIHECCGSKARHPELREYINSTVTRLLPFIRRDWWKEWQLFSSTVRTSRWRDLFSSFLRNQSYGSKVEEAKLKFSFRSFFIKLPVVEPLTKVLPRDCRWEITAYFRSLPQASTSKDAELWIPTDTKQWLQPPLITPVKSMSSEPLGVQLYLEHPSLSELKP